MRIRSTALLLAVIGLLVCSAAAIAATPSLPTSGVHELSQTPPVPLPERPRSPATSTTPATPALPRTGISVVALFAAGTGLLVLGLGAQRATRRQRP